MKVILSNSYSLNTFVPTRIMLQNQGLNNRINLMELRKKFDSTDIGKKLNKILDGTKQHVKTQALIDLVLEEPVPLNEFHDKRILKTLHKGRGRGSMEVSSVVLFYDARKKELKIQALSAEGNILTECIPYDAKINPRTVDYQIYGIYLINLFRSLAIKFKIKFSVPNSYRRISINSDKKKSTLPLNPSSSEYP